MSKGTAVSDLIEGFTHGFLGYAVSCRCVYIQFFHVSFYLWLAWLFQALMPLFTSSVSYWAVQCMGRCCSAPQGPGRLWGVLDCELLELQAETSPPLSFNDCRLMDQNIPLPFWGCCWSHAVRQSALSAEEATCAMYLITSLACLVPSALPAEQAGAFLCCD